MVTAPVLGMCLLLVNIKYQWVFTQFSLDKLGYNRTQVLVNLCKTTTLVVKLFGLLLNETNCCFTSF